MMVRNEHPHDQCENRAGCIRGEQALIDFASANQRSLLEGSSAIGQKDHHPRN